jgi:hypothetical protein
MRALDGVGDEFQRKVRTLLRGMTTLSQFRHLLSPWRHGRYAFALLSHKVLRWLVPMLLVMSLLASAVGAVESRLLAVMLLLQVGLYGLALVGMAGPRRIAQSLPAKAAVYFTVSNAAAAVAWLKFLAGIRQELWQPSERSQSTESLPVIGSDRMSRSTQRPGDVAR